MIGSKSFTLFETSDYGVRLEYNKDFVIVHLPYTNKMNAKVFRDMEVKLEEWYEFFTTTGYQGIWAAIDPNDAKIRRLVAMLKFNYIGTSDNMLVYKYGE